MRTIHNGKLKEWRAILYRKDIGGGQKRLKDESVHYDKMTSASAHYKQMKNLVASKVFVLLIKYRKLQCIDNAACRIYKPSGQEPCKGCL